MSNPGPAVTNSASSSGVATIITASTTLAYGVNNTQTTGVNCVMTNVIQAAAGLTLTLPPATGSGSEYQVQIGTTVTSNSVVIQTGVVGSLSDVFQGPINATGAAGAATSWAPVQTAGSKSDVITLNGTTTGGIVGDFFRFTDVLPGVWVVEGQIVITGTAATPYSHV